MRPRPPVLDGIDVARLDELRDLDPGDHTYLGRAIANFERNSAAAPEAMRVLIEAGDAAQLRSSAHRMLGSALNLGATVAVAPLRTLEEFGDRGVTEGAADHLPAVEAGLRQAREQLRAYHDLQLKRFAAARPRLAEVRRPA